MLNGVEIRAKGHPPPSPSHQGRGIINPSPLVGEGRERGIFSQFKGADLNAAFYSSWLIPPPIAKELQRIMKVLGFGEHPVASPHGRREPL
jgi:hypothetical protein